MQENLSLPDSNQTGPPKRDQDWLARGLRLFPVVFILGLSFMFAGCARNYVITLSNGNQITTASKPKLQGGSYYFKDGRGEVVSVSAGRVREIAPASMANEQDRMFIPSTSR